MRGPEAARTGGEPPFRPPTPEEAVIFEAWRVQAARGDLAVRAFETRLARIPAAHPLRGESLRLRVAALAATGDRDVARAALLLLDRLIAREHRPDDYLWRAELALAAGEVPPSSGCQDPDPALGLAAGTLTGPRPLRHLLKCANGFAGFNAAAVFSAPE